MKTIFYDTIVEKVEQICLTAAFDLPEDALSAIRKAKDEEKTDLGRSLLDEYIANADIAAEKRMPICQDTGFAVFFVELGQDVHIEGGDLNSAITQGVVRGYQNGYLRKSIVKDPLFDRANTGDNTPPVVHIDIVPGDMLSVTIAPKGGGSENMSALSMLKPSDGVEGMIDFVVKTVVSAGGNPCPPTVVGVGVGGTFEKAALLAKKALLREIGGKNSDAKYAELEETILRKINESGVGPQGLGGSTTAFAVHIEQHPCHIASLPVAVNLNCHAARHAHFAL